MNSNNTDVPVWGIPFLDAGGGSDVKPVVKPPKKGDRWWDSTAADTTGVKPKAAPADTTSVRKPVPEPMDINTASKRPSSWAPMSNEEIEFHKNKAMKMAQEGRSLAELKVYMDTAGVPKKATKMDYAPGTQKHLGGMLMSVLHGATFGWDDEAVGSIYGIVSGAGAQAGRDSYRRSLQAFHDANPGTDLVLQMVGGGGVTGIGRKMLGIAAPKAAEYLMHLGAAKRLIGGGAIGGAAYAAGDVQGGTGERLGAVPGGAALGGVGAGVVGGLGAVAGKVVKPFVRNSKVLQKTLPGTFPSTKDEVKDIILRDLRNDAPDGDLTAMLDGMLMKARSQQAQGLTPTLVDLAGQNTLNRMGGVQSASGKGMEALKTGFKDRQMGQGDRILDWFQGRTKLGLQNIEEVTHGYLGARSMDGQLLYDDAYKLNAPVTDKLKSLLRNEKFIHAWNEARLELREQPGGLDVGPLSKPFFPHGVGPAYSAAAKNVPEIDLKTGLMKNKVVKVPPQQGVPQEIYPTELSIAGLDYMKRYLDRIVRSGANSESGWNKGIAHGIAKNLEEALEEIDALVPQYGAARKTWHSDTRVIDALADGRKFFGAGVDEIEFRMQGHKSAAEVEAFKLGVISDIKEKIWGNNNKVPDMTRMFYGKGAQRKLRAVFGTEADEILDRVRAEARFGETYGKTQGSRTPTILGMMAENEASEAAIAGAAAVGRLGTGGIYLARLAGTKFRLEHGARVAEGLSEAYTKGLDDPAKLIGYLLDLQSYQPRPSGLPQAAGAVIGGQLNANPYVPE